MRKLYRSRDNKMLSGLCGGLGELTNIDATLIRILLVVLTIFSSGLLILAYIIVSMVVPKTPDIHGPFGQYRNPYNGTYGGHQGPYGSQDPMHGTRFNQQQPNFNQSNWDANRPPSQPTYGAAPQQDNSSMEDLEKKALRREIEELKNKLSKIEKGE